MARRVGRVACVVLVAVSLGGWSVRSSTTDGSSLFAISCPSRSVCFAVGQDRSGRSLLERSANGGGTWTSMNGAASGLVLSAISCGDVEHCVASGWNTNAALYTTDSGTHWHSVVLPTPGNGVSAVSCVDALHCFVAPGSDHVDMTSDGGATWTTSPPLSLPLPPNQYFRTDVQLRSMTCPSHHECLVMGTESAFAYNPDPFPAPPVLETDSGILAVTTDGGATWRTQFAPNLIHAIACLTPVDCVAFGTGGNYRIMSADGGGSWTVSTFSIPGLHNLLWAADVSGPPALRCRRTT